MARDIKPYTPLNGAVPKAIVSSTNAGPIEVTVTAHGYSTGDKVTIVSHAVNTAANGTWKITVTGANTFTLDGSTGNGVGGATGFVYPASKIAFAGDYEHLQLAIDADAAASLTIKVVGSLQDNPPDFGKPQSSANQWDYVQIINLSDSVEVDGATGIPLAAATLHAQYEVNVNGLRWFTVIYTAWTSGSVVAKAQLFNSPR
jgi:hypothetical protein